MLTLFLTGLLYILVLFSSTPNVGGAGLDLIIIMACLSLLVGMVYLFKFLLEKYHIARNHTVWDNNAGDTIERREE
jgi:hypothetical protein